MIAIIDSGGANIASVRFALERLGVDSVLTADPAVRAARRSAEISGSTAAEVAEALRRRDSSDSKVVDFLTAAPGVAVVDSTALDFDETVAEVLAVARRELGGAAPVDPDRVAPGVEGKD